MTPLDAKALRTFLEKGTKFKALGALEGKLETLSVKGRPQFKLFDPVTRDRIACYFSPDRLEEAKTAFPQRVAVYGEIHYDKRGKPLSIINVETIRILRTVEQLPQANEVKGIDITSGIESSEYVRSLRDGG